ncbi:hypothetical protein EGR_08636 [Echinococcus granulosus]|uniref:Uncharacterized protein n=1 Tax=Echinococcus granulosus TaxID=6210 RepID=W6USZ5_ECHGR|nr:hypothetical protein EGR_08636 [Echinococcus granulosus]EUB56514.1 hypothetical protein EGR_08636 [Echinococcus granulosus]
MDADIRDKPACTFRSQLPNILQLFEFDSHGGGEYKQLVVRSTLDSPREWRREKEQEAKAVDSNAERCAERPRRRTFVPTLRGRGAGATVERSVQVEREERRGKTATGSSSGGRLEKDGPEDGLEIDACGGGGGVRIGFPEVWNCGRGSGGGGGGGQIWREEVVITVINLHLQISY